MIRIVLTFDEMEFARLAGAAAARSLCVKDFVMQLVRMGGAPPCGDDLIDGRCLNDHFCDFNREVDRAT
jgi:hypothetical protein